MTDRIPEPYELLDKHEREQEHRHKLEYEQRHKLFKIHSKNYNFSECLSKSERRLEE